MAQVFQVDAWANAAESRSRTGDERNSKLPGCNCPLLAGSAEARTDLTGLGRDREFAE